MPTPMFKVLAQSLRLGQPPDATTAVRVLVEVLEKQQAELDDLRSKLSIAASRLQYAEARLARLLEHAEGEAGAAPPSAPQAPRSSPPRAPEPSTRPSQRPPAIPNAPPIPKAARVPSIPAAVPVPAADWYAVPPEMPSLTDGLDEFNQTLVIHKRDLQARAEAPFPLAPASERPRAQTAQGTPFQPRAASEPPPPPPPRIADPSTYAMEDDFRVDLPEDEGDGATVTDRVAREALDGFADLEARHSRGGHGDD